MVYRDTLPENVMASLENAVGAYKFESLPLYSQEWTTQVNCDDVCEKLHAIFDLYGVTPESLIADLTISQVELEEKVSQNPKIDMSQYKTFEDGWDYFPYGSYYGFETIAENEYIRIEGVRDITVGPYEDIVRVARITNISDHPVYVEPYFMDKESSPEITNQIDWPSQEGYEAEYDKIHELTEDTTVLGNTGKDILLPGEQTSVGIAYNKHTDFNSHWYFRTYEITEEEAQDWIHVKFNQSIEHEAESGERKKGKDMILILKNRTNADESFEYATVKGTLYNTDGEPLAYMPFTMSYVEPDSESVGNRVENRQYLTNYDGSFEFQLPVVMYKTDCTYARYTISVNGEKAMIDGRFCSMVIDDMYALEDEIQDESIQMP